MHRRAFLAAAGLGLAPFTGRAQPAAKRMPRVAVFMYGPPANIKRRVEAFAGALRALGYEDGRNVRIEVRSANGQPALVEEIAASLARDGVDVVLSGSTTTTKALLDHKRKLPVVMAAAEDPVAEGFVQSLARPGGNITGLSATVLDLVSRHVDLLGAVVPRLSRVAALVAPANPTYREYVHRLHGAMRQDMKLALFDVREPGDVDEAFLPRSRGAAQALVVMNDPLLYNERRHIAELAGGVRLPAIYPARGFVEVGGLMSYGPNPEANFARAASFVDRILKGAHPAELPVEPPARIELVVSREAARLAGVTLPARLLKEASAIR